jgi:hypothetical protein
MVRTVVPTAKYSSLTLRAPSDLTASLISLRFSVHFVSILVTPPWTEQRFGVDPDAVLANILHARAYNHEMQMEFLDMAAGIMVQERLTD